MCLKSMDCVRVHVCMCACMRLLSGAQCVHIYISKIITVCVCVCVCVVCVCVCVHKDAYIICYFNIQMRQTPETPL